MIPKHSYWQVLTLTSGVLGITLLFSTLTHKWVALSMGPEGIALLGTYRSFTFWISSLLGFGYSVLLNQKSSKEDVGFFLSLSLLQCLATLVALGAILIFGGNATLLVLLGSSLLNAICLNGLGVLRGARQLKELALLQIGSAVLSLLLLFYLVQFSGLGLAISTAVGAGFSSVGVALLFRKSFKEIHLGKAIQRIQKNFFKSSLLVWQLAFSTGALLLVQRFILKFQGLEVLGNFNASYALVDTSLSLLVASFRPNLLPLLNFVKDPEEKEKLFKRQFALHMRLAAVAGVLLILLSPWVIPLFFSSAFKLSQNYLLSMGVGLVFMVGIGLYSIRLIEQEAYFTHIVLDTLWVGSFIGLGGLLASRGGDELPYAYLGSAVFGFLLYAGWFKFAFRAKPETSAHPTSGAESFALR